MSSFDEILDALAAVQRRRLLINLVERGPPLDIAAVVRGGPDRPTPTEQRTRLHHVHLPKLASLGFIRWNEDRGEVRRGPAFDEIEPLLKILLENETELSADWLSH